MTSPGWQKPRHPGRSRAHVFFIGHNNVVSGEHPLLPSWQRRLFLMLSRFAASPTDFLGLPANRTVELGSRIEVYLSSPSP